MSGLKLNGVFISIVLLLVGCKTVSKLDKSDEYKKALPYGDALIVPSDLSSGSVENYYPVPKLENNKGIIDVSTSPPKIKIGAQ